MSEADKIMENIAKGATKAVIETAEDQIPTLIQRLVQKLMDKDIAFIQDPKDIESVKEKKKLPEYKTFCKYISDPDLKIQFQMGLQLRELYKNGEYKKQDKLMDKIYHKYKAPGLHVAKFVCDGIFTKFYGNILEKSKTEEQLNFEINNFFKNIEAHTAFVQSKDSVITKTKEITTKILAHSPPIFIISCIIMAKKATQIKDKVMKSISDYTYEKYESEFKDREIFLILHK